MNPLPPALEAHIQRDVTTLAFCWTVKRRDGLVLGFTDHDAPLTLDGVIHDPQTGFNASAAESALGLQTQTMDLDGALSSQRISADDLMAGKYDRATVETWLVNWSDPQARTLLRTAVIGRIDMSGNAYKVELQSLAEAMDRRRGRLVRRRCDAELGDTRCGKDVSGAAWRGTGTVADARGAADFTATGLAAFAAQWFEQGVIEWQSGDNAGLTSQVAAHEAEGPAARFALWLPMPKPIRAGDLFTVTAGCDKRFATCKQKFSNSLNFQGFPHLPGNDAVYTYVNGDGIFDGAPLVP
jgi:uncharacterized phage protein (TIGR02218 family)